MSCSGTVLTDDHNNSGGRSGAVANGGSSIASGMAGLGDGSGHGGSKAASASTAGSNASSAGDAGAAGLGTSDPGSAGTGSTSAGTGGVAAGGSAGTGATGGVLDSGKAVPLTPIDAWVDGSRNPLKIRGALFAAGDETSMMGLSTNFVGANACIAGTAAKVDMAADVCVTKMFPPPATDCYGYFRGVDLALNLNQMLDPATMSGATPNPFDASALQGFSFELEGTAVPPPASLRFQVETADREFCNPASKKITFGTNVVLFSELVSQCFRTTTPPAPTADTAKSALIRISWHVVTNVSSTVPFDFCVSNLRALLK